MTKIAKKIDDIKLSHYVVFSIATLLIYSVVEFTVSTITQISHDTLTLSLFGLLGGEVLSCCLIKLFKLKRSE